MTNDEGHEPSSAVLRRFAAKEATPSEREAVLRHLRAGCAVCRCTLRLAGWHGPEREAALCPGRKDGPGLPAGAYDDAFAAADRAAHAALKRKHLPAQRLLTELDRLPAEEQGLRVRNLRRYASPALSAALVERSHVARFGDHKEMLRCAQLALAAAEAARTVDAGGPSLLADCRARAWAQLGNAQRVRSDLAGAERSFDSALSLLKKGTGDAELRAWVLHHFSSLGLCKRDFRAAIALLEEVVEIHRDLHDRAGEAAALIKLALAKIYAGQPAEAIEPLHSAIPLLTPHDIDLLRTAVHNLVLCYQELGEPKHAYGLMADAEPHFTTCSDPIVMLHVNWVRGKIERDLGLLDAAEIRLLRVREALLERDLSFDVAVLSLDLAEVYALWRRVPELVSTVGETIPIFQGLGVTRDLLASLLKLQEVAHQQVTALGLLRDVLGQVKNGLPQAANPAALDAAG